MYEDIRRERLLRMQTLTRPGPVNINTGSSQTNTVTFVAVILFALSGLITGFAFGAFVHLSPAKTSGQNTNLVIKKQKTGDTTPAVVKTVQPVVPLGWPSITASVYTQIANGSTVYTTSVQVTDQSKGQASGNAVHASGITCKIWLAKDKNINAMLREDNYKIPRTVSALNQPFPDEVPGGLNFATNTPQTQTCDANGTATWNYTISPTVAPGSYNLAAITDWDGKHYNWSWTIITIKQAS